MLAPNYIPARLEDRFIDPRLLNVLPQEARVDGDGKVRIGSSVFLPQIPLPVDERVRVSLFGDFVIERMTEVEEREYEWLAVQTVEKQLRQERLAQEKVARLIPEDGTITVFSPNAPVHTTITYEDLRNAFREAGYRWTFSHIASVPDDNQRKYGNAHKSDI